MALNKTWKKGWKKPLRLSEKQEKIMLALRIIEKRHEADLFTLEQLATFVGMKLSTVHYNISKLKERGLIYSPHPQAYRFTSDGQKIFTRLMERVSLVGERLRPHWIQCVLELLKPPKNLKKLKHVAKEISNGRYTGFSVHLDGAKFIFYSDKKVVVSFQGFAADTVADIESELMVKYAYPMIDYLEKEFDCKVNRNSIEIKPRHVADTYSEFAKLFKNLNYSFASNVLHVDASHGIPEIETVGDDALENMEKLLPILNHLEQVLRSKKQIPRFRWGDKLWSKK